jgi:hypothetical protein
LRPFVQDIAALCSLVPVWHRCSELDAHTAARGFLFRVLRDGRQIPGSVATLQRIGNIALTGHGPLFVGPQHFSASDAGWPRDGSRQGSERDCGYAQIHVRPLGRFQYLLTPPTIRSIHVYITSRLD